MFEGCWWLWAEPGGGKHTAAVFYVNKYTWCSQSAAGFPLDTCCWSLWGFPVGDVELVWAILILCRSTCGSFMTCWDSWLIHKN